MKIFRFPRRVLFVIPQLVILCLFASCVEHPCGALGVRYRYTCENRSDYQIFISYYSKVENEMTEISLPFGDSFCRDAYLPHLTPFSTALTEDFAMTIDGVKYSNVPVDADCKSEADFTDWANYEQSGDVIRDVYEYRYVFTNSKVEDIKKYFMKID